MIVKIHLLLFIFNYLMNKFWQQLMCVLWSLFIICSILYHFFLENHLLLSYCFILFIWWICVAFFCQKEKLSSSVSFLIIIISSMIIYLISDFHRLYYQVKWNHSAVVVYFIWNILLSYISILSSTFWYCYFSSCYYLLKSKNSLCIKKNNS